jgi:hypothetical protein
MVITLAKSFNEDKRAVEDHAILKEVFEMFCDKDARDLKAELNSFERKFVKEGSLVKQRLSHRQRRQLFLFSDILLYAEAGVAGKGFKLKGKILGFADFALCEPERFCEIQSANHRDTEHARNPSPRASAPADLQHLPQG